jgi:AbrB family looped-hinge helix DNA binding protein
MATAALTSKGQITIPIQVREDLGLKTGDRVSFIKGENGEYILKAKTGSIMDLKGIFKRTGPPLTIEEMDEAVGKYLAEDDARITGEYSRHIQGKAE